MAFAVRASAVVCGAAILAASASAVIEHGHQDASQARLTWSLALGVLAGSMAIGSAWASGRKALAVMLAVALLAGEAFGVLATADRIVSEREQGQAAIRTAIGAHDYAAGEAARAQNALDDANKAAVAQAALAGCKSNCRALLEAQVENAKADLNTARTRLGANPKPTAAPDALAERLGWQPWVLDLLVAGCLSLGANGLAAALIGFGAHGSTGVCVAKVQQADAAAQAADTAAPPVTTLIKPTSVVQFPIPKPSPKTVAPITLKIVAQSSPPTPAQRPNGGPGATVAIVAPIVALSGGKTVAQTVAQTVAPASVITALVHAQKGAEIPFREIYDAHLAQADTPLSRKALATALKIAGFTCRELHGRIIYVGLTLRADARVAF